MKNSLLSRKFHTLQAENYFKQEMYQKRKYLLIILEHFWTTLFWLLKQENFLNGDALSRFSMQACARNAFSEEKKNLFCSLFKVCFKRYLASHKPAKKVCLVQSVHSPLWKGTIGMWQLSLVWTWAGTPWQSAVLVKHNKTLFWA